MFKTTNVRVSVATTSASCDCRERAWLSATLLLLIFITAPAHRSAAEEQPPSHRPNILVLLADDQRADTISALGNTHVRTPNIDSLVQGGFHFQRAYCMGSMGGAVCVPSRAMLNSGRSLFRVSNKLTNCETLPERLQRAGYHTFGTGKWHNGQTAFLRSFSEGKAVFFGGMCDHTKVPVVDTTDGRPPVNKRIGASFSSTLFADAAIDFLQDYNQTEPFYAYVAFTAPHDPRQAPHEYLAMYDAAKMPLSANFLPQHPFDNGWLTIRDENLAAWPRTAETIREQTAEYFALLTHMDHEIGRILTALDEAGHADNTIVVYAADHGLALGSHGLLGKQSLYEHSMRAPLIFAGPGIPANASSEALVYLYDVFPTLCELAGIQSTAGIDGRSLTPILRGEQPGIRNSLFTAFSKDMRSIRDDRWKLIRYPSINKSQLFDLDHDPHELVNLADDPQHARRLAHLTALLEESQSKAGDELPLTSDNPAAAEIDLTGRPRRPDRHQPDWIVQKYFTGNDSKSE